MTFTEDSNVANDLFVFFRFTQSVYVNMRCLNVFKLKNDGASIKQISLSFTFFKMWLLLNEILKEQQQQKV